jgi:hypothetical protein
MRTGPRTICRSWRPRLQRLVLLVGAGAFSLSASGGCDTLLKGATLDGLHSFAASLIDGFFLHLRTADETRIVTVEAPAQPDQVRGVC